ncbi:putative bifunctional diguanylate cyclase/phosphodiesterase [Streptomyces sp. NPDC059740]|uniref:putative bifunctional diguanylate cyclase/phosphodiesterase n=1 Tax=Streptomyces sp. NPDC059740 TaxID=3346926 RepID=UPI0036554342
MSTTGVVLDRPGRERSGAQGSVAQAALAVLCAAYALGAGLGWGSHEVSLVMGDFGLSSAALVAAVSCFRYARAHGGRTRPAWLLFAVSSLMASLGNGVWGWYEVVLREPVPSPSAADFCFLLFAPPAIIGLLVLAKRPVNRAGWVCLGLDAWLIGGSLLTLSWSLALAHTAHLQGVSVARGALTLAYPLLDIVLVSMVLALHFKRSAANRSAVNTAIGALALTVLCDALFSSPLLREHYRSGQLLDAGWFAGSLLLAYAPWVARRMGATPPAGRSPAGAGHGAAGTAERRGSGGAGAPRRPARPVAPAASRPRTASRAEVGSAVPALDGVPPRPRSAGRGEVSGRPIAGSLAALTPYLAAAVCTLGILYNVLDGRRIDRMVLFTGCTVVLALVVRQGIMLMDNIALAQELAHKENHFRSLVQGSSDVIMIADAEGELRYVSPAAAGVYGREPQAMVGSPLAALIHPDDLGAVTHEIRRFLAADPHAEPTTRIECRFRSGHDHSGGPVWLNVESTVSRHEGGLILNSRDVTERVRLQAQLQHNASHDTLTDLPNRALFTERVGKALGGRRSCDHDTAVLYIDLDGFKQVNDTIGHQAGDELLVQAARRLAESVRAGDTAARLGGDEFAALIMGDGTRDRGAREYRIREIADRLRIRLSEPYRVDGREARVAASIGIAFAEPGITPAVLIRHADAAMYCAKQAGKGRVELYTPQTEPSPREASGARAGAKRGPGRENGGATARTAAPVTPVVRAATAAPRRPGLDDGEFTLVHQPVVELATGRITAVTAQPRWRSAHGILFAAADLPGTSAQEGTGPAEREWHAAIERRQLEAAIDQAAARHRAGYRVPVVVRVAARHLVDERGLPPDVVCELLARGGLPPAALVMELTDVTPPDDPEDWERWERPLVSLRRLGVRVALDAFSRGQVAVGPLRRLPVDIVRLERGLVDGVVDSARLHKITAGLLGIAADLGMRSIAEGVDLPEQIRALRAMGCTHGQGRAFAGPLDEHRLRRALTAGGYSLPRKSGPGARESVLSTLGRRTAWPDERDEPSLRHLAEVPTPRDLARSPRRQGQGTE